MQGLVVLPEDVQIVPLSEMSAQVRGQVSGEDSDFALTRPRSRVPSKVIDANSATLLRQFRTPKTIVEGLLAFSREIKATPSEVLDEAYPLIESCLLARILVEPGADSEKIAAAFAVGESIAGHTVVRPIQALIDSEVYQVSTPSGRHAALKITTVNGTATTKPMLEKEACHLTRIGGAPSPALLQTGVLADHRQYLITEWFAGDDAETVARNFREQATPETANDLCEICAEILDGYATLHERGILHGDVHPRNVLVSPTGEVRIIDFGIASEIGTPPTRTSRAGVAFFFDPEYAAAVRSGRRVPLPDQASEQYGVAALIYSLLCGQHYVDFSWDKEELLRQIAEDQPLPFQRRGADRFAAMEAVIMQALSKDPAGRFATIRDFATAFRQALQRRAATPAPAQFVTRESDKLLARVLNLIGDPNRALTYPGPESPVASVTYGYGGIAYAAYRIACTRDDSRLLSVSDAWAERAAFVRGDNAFYNEGIQITPEVVGRVSPYHTASGISCVQALIANARGDGRSMEAALNAFLRQTMTECDNPDLTLGTASILLGLTLLIEACDTGDSDVLLARGNELQVAVNRVLEDPVSPIPYLGIAHGWAGLLYASLRWSALTQTGPIDAVRRRLNELARQAMPTRRGARWPMQATSGSLALSGWCNGSAGYAHLWTLAHKTYADPHYLDLAQRAAMDAWEGTGGGYGLCCGYAGQAYAQLSLYKHTGESIWLDQARTLAEKAATAANLAHRQGSEGLPFSLYKGDVGVAVLIADLERPQLAAMPFFESTS